MGVGAHVATEVALLNSKGSPLKLQARESNCPVKLDNNYRRAQFATEFPLDVALWSIA